MADRPPESGQGQDKARSKEGGGRGRRRRRKPDANGNRAEQAGKDGGRDANLHGGNAQDASGGGNMLDSQAGGNNTAGGGNRDRQQGRGRPGGGDASRQGRPAGGDAARPGRPGGAESPRSGRGGERQGRQGGGDPQRPGGRNQKGDRQRQSAQSARVDKPAPKPEKPEPPFKHVLRTYGLAIYETHQAAKADRDALVEKAKTVDQLNIVIRAEGSMDDPELISIGNVKVFAGTAWALIHDRRVADGWYNEPR